MKAQKAHAGGKHRGRDEEVKVGRRRRWTNTVEAELRTT